MAERTTFPPKDFTEDERAAVAGRFVMDPKAEPDPAGSGKEGREKAAPHGVVYVRAESFDAATVAPAEPDEEEAEDEEPEEEQAEEEDYESWTVQELKDTLDSMNIEYDAKAHKADLITLMREAEGG
jgi:arginyl-tRNA synthetase